MLGNTPIPFLFIHIPKTAGTSVENALLKTVTGKDKVHELDPAELSRHALHGGDRPGAPGGRSEIMSGVIQHESVRYFEKRGLLDGRFVFTVVRNPFDRALSELFYLLKISAVAREMFRGPTWAEDLKRYAEFDGYLGHDLGACQLDWLTDKAQQIRCDKILRFESLEADWRVLCAELGIEATLPHSMRGGRYSPWWKFYDDDALALIAHKYARDFVAFGYKPEVPVQGMVEYREPTKVSISTMPGFFHHRRLEVAAGSLDEIVAQGVWENLDPATAARVAGECHRALKVGGVLRITTLDLSAIGSLLRDGNIEGETFVRNYLDKHIPESPLYAPALAINHLIRSCTFAYDEGMLIETLAEGGFGKFDRLDPPDVGMISVLAHKDESLAC